MTGARDRANGVVIFEGRSEIDGGPIVAIATGVRRQSSNSKTGSMLQTWIIRSDLAPSHAVESGADRSVCGDCRLRDSACYVTLHHGPRAVFTAYANGLYPRIEDVGLSWIDDRPIRFGSYGDPAAVPADVWFRLAARASRWTGYTHRWSDEQHQPLRFLLMASVDTPAEAWRARSLGWRTFRVRLADEGLLPCESICPASIEGGKRTSCSECGQCDGARLHDVRFHYSVIAHGKGASAYRRSRLRVL
jgi:hypothetical protein